MHRPEKPAGYKHSSTSGLSPREQLDRQVQIYCAVTSIYRELSFSLYHPLVYHTTFFTLKALSADNGT